MKRPAGQLPWILPGRCEGCADCAGMCPQGCLGMHSTENGGCEVPWIDSPDDCSGCGRCEDACIWGAISMTGYVEEARARLLKGLPVGPPAGPVAAS